MKELWKMGASALAKLSKAGDVSCVEIINAHLERIDQINSDVNAITLILKDVALKIAKRYDDDPNKYSDLPLLGVPFTVKENIDFLKTPTTNGVPYLAHSMPSRNDPIVNRMIEAGAIPIGRTNLPEMGMRLDTDNPLRGRTFNPWNKALTPGGSSGGDGVAIATGMTPFGLGNDIGGSLRNPAYCNGICAIKPSAGIIPWAPSIEPIDMGIPRIFLSNGPMTRSIEDLEIGLSILAGRDLNDPDSIDSPKAQMKPANPKAAFITSIDDNISFPSATSKAIEKATQTLRAEGWMIEEVVPPELERVHQVWQSILRPLIQSLPREIFKKETADYLDRFESSSNYLSLEEALIERQRLRRLWSDFFSVYHVCIGPTWCNLPWPIDSDLDPENGNEVLRKSFAFIAPGNCLGIPSVSMPMGIANNLPTGIQIYSATGAR